MRVRLGELFGPMEDVPWEIDVGGKNTCWVKNADCGVPVVLLTDGKYRFQVCRRCFNVSWTNLWFINCKVLAKREVE
jgi:hypothetical protein